MDIREHLTKLLPPIAAFCADHSPDAWVVGGAARDMALGRTPHDLDIAVPGDGLALARRLADTLGGAFVALDEARGTGRVVHTVSPQEEGRAASRLTIDLVQLRAPTLNEDLRLRDFTINALALPLATAAASYPTIGHGAYIDPCGGLDDIAQRRLRRCLPASLHDDPLRSLRAFRLGAELGLTFAPDLPAALRAAAPLIEGVAAERVRDELLKLLARPAATPWLRAMDEVGLLTRLFPELEPARDCEQPIVHFLPVLAHSLETVAGVEWLLAPLVAGTPSPDEHAALPVSVQTYPDLPRALPYVERLRDLFASEMGTDVPRPALFKLATLLHDNAKPQTKRPKEGGGVTFYDHQKIGAEVAHRAARRLRLSRRAAAYVALVVREHMRPGQLRAAERVTPRAVARFFRDTEDAGPDVLLHELADHLAARGPHIDPADWRDHLAWSSAMLDAYWGRSPEQMRPLLNGNELMAALGIAPGKLVGELLNEVHEAQAAGEIGTPEEALDVARQALAARS